MTMLVVTGLGLLSVRPIVVVNLGLGVELEELDLVTLVNAVEATSWPRLSKNRKLLRQKVARETEHMGSSLEELEVDMEDKDSKSRSSSVASIVEVVPYMLRPESSFPLGSYSVRCILEWGDSGVKTTLGTESQDGFWGNFLLPPPPPW